MIYIYYTDNHEIKSQHQDSDLNSVLVDINIHNLSNERKVDLYKDSEATYKVVDNFLVERTSKERSEFLISIGQLVIANTEKIDDNGQIVSKTNKEKYTDNLISESDYKKILCDQVKINIYNKFNNEIENGFHYANLQFQANEESTNRITKAVSLVDKSYQLTNVYNLPTWVSNSLDENGLDIRYTFVDYSDLINFAIQMGLFWESCFFKAKNLCDDKENSTIEQLENFDVDAKWNE